MQITWKIENLEREVETGLVTTIHWRITAEDQGRCNDAYGSIRIKGDAEAPGFIPYSEITQDIAIDWLKNRLQQLHQLDPTYRSPEQIEDEVSQSVRNIIVPKYKLGKPWG